MSHQNDVYKGLVAVEPPPTDIFRVFRANHPETLAFNPPVREDKPVPDFTPETSVTLRSGEKVTQPVSVLPILMGAAAVSAATRQMNEVMDVNELLAAGNWAAAEDILGRKLTVEEKQQQQILQQVAPDEEKAARELKMEALKGRIKTYRTKYKALLAKWKAAQDKASKDKYAALLAKWKAEIKLVDDELLRMAHGWDNDDDEDAPGFLATHVPLPHDPDDVNTSFDTYFDNLNPEEWFPSAQDEHADIREQQAQRLKKAVWEGDKKRAKDGEEKEDTEEEDEEEDEEDLPSYAQAHADAPNPFSADLVVPLMKTKPDYQARAAHFLQAYKQYPRVDKHIQTLLKDYKTLNKPELVAYVGRIQEIIQLEHDKFEQLSEKGKREAATKTDESMQGHGLFTGLRRPKNPQDFVAFGPRMVIDLKKLKTSGQFSLIYPQSGQKNSVIRNAVLTPALKEVILSYLAKEPMDTMNLNKEENDWLQFIWKHTGLAKKQPKMRLMPDQSKPATMARLKILLGEYAAGNDNDEIATEVDKLLRYVEGKRWMTAGQIIKFRQMMSEQE